jgi:chromosome segregation ATPase
MPCFALGKGEREKAELRELLELANAQREEFRKQCERQAKENQELSRKLEKSQRDVADLHQRLQASSQREAQLDNNNQNLELKVSGLHAALDKASLQHDEDEERVVKLTAQRDAAQADVRKLSKDREYLKHRVERMQKALSMLESVLDDTLRESQATEQQRGSAAAALRASIELCNDKISQEAATAISPASSGPVQHQIQELLRQAAGPGSSPPTRSSGLPPAPTRAPLPPHPGNPTGSGSSSSSRQAAEAGVTSGKGRALPAVDTWRLGNDQKGVLRG